jgi:hypothetical protein
MHFCRYDTHRPNLLAGLVADSEGGSLALENSVSCKQIPAKPLPSPPLVVLAAQSTSVDRGERSMVKPPPPMSMWWWGAADVILGTATAQDKFLAEIQELGAGKSVQPVTLTLVV